MARYRSPLRNWLEYLALRGFCAFSQCFDVKQNLASAATVGSVFCRFNRRRRLRAERNIALSFPDWSDERVRETAERSMEHMIQVFMVEAHVGPRLITRRTWPHFLDLIDLDEVLDRLVQSQPMVMVTGHCGNWELLGYALSVIGFPVTAIARPLDNPLLNAWLLAVREARGMRIVTKWGSTPILEETIREGGRVAFIGDQNAGERGLFVPFFGRLASSYKAIGLLAMRYGVPVVAGHAMRVNGDLRYAITSNDVITPDDWVDQPDPLFYVTARYNRAIERMIRDAPEQYLWLHRRWKTRPRHEREGKPMPRRLREKLESLPWMTQEELDRIVSLSNNPEHQEVR